MTTPVPMQPTAAPLPLRKRLERTAGRAAMRVFLGPLRMLPLSVARAMGKCMGWMLYHCLGRYRRVALKNLNLVYGDRPAKDRAHMAMAVFRHFGEMSAEFIKLPQLTHDQVDQLVT